MDDVLGIQTVSETDVMEIPIVVKSDETDYLESVIRVPSADGTESEIILCISVDHIMSEVDFENIKRSLEESGNEEEEMIR